MNMKFYKNLAIVNLSIKIVNACFAGEYKTSLLLFSHNNNGSIKLFPIVPF